MGCGAACHPGKTTRRALIVVLMAESSAIDPAKFEITSLLPAYSANRIPYRIG